MQNQHTELARLAQRYKVEIDQKRAEIEALVKKQKVLQDAIDLLDLEGSGIQDILFGDDIIVSQKYSGFTLKQAIIDILYNNTRAISRNDILESLKLGGFTSCSSNMGGDVSVALNKMKKANVVKQIKRGKNYRYMMKEVKNDDVTQAKALVN